MKRLISLFSLFCLFTTVISQNIGIGTVTPDASAKLDISATNRGLLIPRVSLTAIGATAPITAPATGLLVYNSNTLLPDGEGFYYWNGAQWLRLSTAGALGTDVDANDGLTVAYPNVDINVNNGLSLGADNVQLGGTLIQNTTVTQDAFEMIYDLTGTGNFEVRKSGATDVFVSGSTGNVGIGQTNPNYGLEINGSFGFGNGIPGVYRSRTEIKDDAGQQGSQSGMFETYAPFPAANWYTGAWGGQHLLDVRHSNNANNYAMQMAGSFFDQDFYVRKVNNDPTQAWSRMITSSNLSANAILNQTTQQTSANFNISDNGVIGLGLTVGASVTIDNSNGNTGFVSSNALLFGNASGEGIASKRDAGGNQYGLDFYTGSANRMAITSTGNIGMGITNPNYGLELNGSFGFGNGVPGVYRSRTETRDDAGQQGSQSGMFETSFPFPASNWYTGASGEQHLLDVRHSNNGNNFAMQMAGSFFDQDFYVRKVNNNPTQAWSRMITSANLSSSAILNQNTSAQSIANFWISGDGYINGNVGIGTSTPTEKLDVEGNVKFSGALMPNNISGISGQVLTSGGTGVAPTWTNVAGALGTDTDANDGLTVAYPNLDINVNNGLSLSNDNIQLGGALVQNTTVTQNTFGMIYDLTGTGNFEVRKSGATDVFVSGTNGNVGIGTSAPNAKLDVAGNVKFSGALMPNNLCGISGQVLTSGGTGVAPTWASVAGALGTDTDANDGLTVAYPDLDINVNNGLSLSNDNIQLGGALVQNTTVTQNTFGMIYDLTGTGNFEVRKSGTTDVFVSGANGNVGIGTASPTRAILEQYGMVGNTSAIFGGNASGIALVTNYPGIYFNSYFNTTYKSLAAGYSADITLDPTDGKMNFVAHANATAPNQSVVGNIRMTILNNGNIGINNINATNLLDIAATSRSGTHPNGLGLYVTTNSNANSNGVEFRHSNGTQGIGFGFNTIYAAGANTIQDLGMSSKGTGALTFTTNNVERMRIDGSGNVGIATSAPTAKLDVVGPTTRSGSMGGATYGTYGQYDGTTFGYLGTANAGGTSKYGVYGQAPAAIAGTWTDGFETTLGWNLFPGTGLAAIGVADTTDCLNQGYASPCLTAVARTGSKVLNFRNCDNSSSSYASITLTVGTGGGTFSGFYKIGSEVGFDFFKYGINTAPNTIVTSGCQDTWTAFSFPVAAGSNTIYLGYYTDGGAIVSGSKMYLDDIQCTNVLIPTHYAGYFSGSVAVTGSISKGSGSFLIDHPDAPETMTLRHDFVESPRALNLYPGKITLNANGQATVTMPAYFKGLNKEEEGIVHLTPIGKKPFLASYEWNEGFTTFIIYGEANASVAYEVIVERDDPTYNALKKPVEEIKGVTNGMKSGMYLYPAAYGKDEKLGIGYGAKPTQNNAPHIETTNTFQFLDRPIPLPAQERVEPKFP